MTALPDIFFTYLLAFCRSVIALVFAYSFIGKVSNPSAFERTINSFGMIPKRFSKSAALLFLCCEIAVFILVVAPIGSSILQTVGFGLAALFLLLFSATLASALARSIRTTCNCFGSSEKPVSWYDVWRNVGFILCAAAGWVALNRLEGKHIELGLVEWGAAVFGAAIFVAVWVNVRDIVELLRPRGSNS